MEQPITGVQNNISTVFIHFDNLEAACEWYQQYLGLSIRKKDLVKGFVEMNMEGVNLSLLTWRTDNKVQPEHPTFCFYTSDIEQSYKDLKHKGVEVYDIDNAGSVSCFRFKDLEGNMLLVCT
ncbi:hypothetical protein DNH61_06320 [Paenibacillus sambharensis]|uniref:VOC domain-containing protein n=1 Tax=Paenibacillus sambharensis TaxID=1803190 RepID=A0A2W1LDT3_9BACL|nr:VOC family protein [Paenibacillus sambharensis]PZD96809.1 hypothetical protein DNH61_06320 [Paenibacillus sambharensis]